MAREGPREMPGGREPMEKFRGGMLTNEVFCLGRLSVRLVIDSITSCITYNSFSEKYLFVLYVIYVFILYT